MIAAFRVILILSLLSLCPSSISGYTIDNWLWFQRDIRTVTDLEEFFTGPYNMARTRINLCDLQSVNETEEQFLVYGHCDENMRNPKRQLQYILDRLTVADSILLIVHKKEAWTYCQRLIPHPFIDDNIYIFFPLVVGPNGNPSRVMTLNDTNVIGYTIVAGFDEGYGDDLGYTEDQLSALYLATKDHPIFILQFDALHFSQMTAKVPKILPRQILFSLGFSRALEKEMNKAFLRNFIRAYHNLNGLIYYSLDHKLSCELDPREDSEIAVPHINPPPKTHPPSVPRLRFMVSKGLASHTLTVYSVLGAPLLLSVACNYLLFFHV